MGALKWKIGFFMSIPLISIWSVAASQGEFIVQIDRTNGSYIKIGPAIAGITYIYPDDRTLDESTGTFYFPASTPDRLYSVAASNGSTVNNPSVNHLNAFQFDNSTGLLYGLEQDNTNNVKYFVSINSITGASTRVGSSIPSSSVFGGAFSTYNNTTHTFIFLDPPNLLYSVNATNGSVISSPALALASGESIATFTFDNSTGILYGLVQDSNLKKYFLVTIDPNSGILKRIGSGTTFGAGGGSATIDEPNQQYIYMYSDATGYVITTLDISTGNFLYHALIEAFNNNDNYFSLKYDNTHGKLFGIHWETFGTDVAETIASNNIIDILPNPNNGIFSIETRSTLPQTFEIFNLLGERIYSMKTSSEKIEVDISHEAKGIYFYRVLSENKLIGSGKMVIE